MERYTASSPRERRDTPEIVTLQFRRFRFRSLAGWILSMVLALGSGGGVAVLADRTQEIETDAAEAKRRADESATRAKVLDRTTDAAYANGAAKDLEHDQELAILRARFNDLREYAIATRSSSNRGQKAKPPEPVAARKPIPVPPTVDAAAAQPVPKVAPPEPEPEPAPPPE